ncbi:tetratricopeptide repeat protein [Siphonobacter sp. SORGH_AS_0500]|uniref:tetratricopeptide repeat protein n=1 Tax=Siphonobacter sp. SORGH_AS_0500 TaxID=1864824 RepID=UPI002866FEEC|nr:tetratricopeptide repeat protein [Siphonobacter sp. SORGH_AS_0500]MDR6195238.1 tetratricopeptide (TPR) repeat protein [Siphonobacter sp. SORGH_AS_0500]
MNANNVNTWQRAISSTNMRLLSLLFLVFSVSCGNQREQEAYQFFLRGNDQLLKQDYPQAIRFYTEAIKKKEDFSEALTNRGLSYLQQGDTEKALSDLNNSLKINPKLGSTYQNRGNLFSLEGQYAPARKDLEEAVKLIPDSSSAWALLGNAQYMTGQEDLAFSSFDKAAQLRPSDYTTYAFRGWIYVLRKEYAKAQEDFKKVLQYKPNEPSSVNNLAMVSTMLGNPQEGLKWADLAVKITEGKLLAYSVNNRAFALLELNRLEEAKAELDRSLRLEENNAWAYRNLGIYYLKKSDAAKALQELQKAEKLDPSVDEINYYFGKTYELLGQSAEKCKSWQKGAALHEKKALEAAKTCR